MQDVVNNLDYKRYPKEYLISARYSMAIRVEEEFKVIVAYDFINLEILRESEGILKHVNTELGSKIEQYFNITLSQYGVTVL
ncbi:MAG: hypothetical protein Q9M40_08345 [Sulfurimonas sp.]|nr:hypothetical protein [Sulfurimonas sp.]